MMLLLIAMLQVAPSAPTAVACIDSREVQAGEEAACSGWLVSPLRIRDQMRRLDECRSDLKAAFEREDAFKAHQRAVRLVLAPAVADGIAAARESLGRLFHLEVARPKRAFYDRPWVWTALGAAVGVGGYKLYRWLL